MYRTLNERNELLADLIHNSPHLTEIEWEGSFLLFKTKETDDHKLIEMADCLPHNTHVKTLSLLECNITDAGLVALGKAIALQQQITEFTLIWGKQISDEGIIALCDALMRCKNMETLWMMAEPMTDKGAIAMSHVLQKNKQVECLGIGSKNITEKGLKAIADSLQDNTSIKFFDLVVNSLEKDELKYFKTIFENSDFFDLTVDCEFISDENAQCLNECLLNNAKVNTFSFSAKKMSDTAFQYITDIPKYHPHLESFIFTSDLRAVERAKILAEALQQSKIMTYEIGHGGLATPESLAILQKKLGTRLYKNLHALSTRDIDSEGDSIH